MRVAELAAVLVLLSTVSGCAGPETAAPLVPSASGTGVGADGAAGDAANDSAPEPPVARTLYLAKGVLVDGAPAAASEAMAGGYADCFTRPPCNALEYRSAKLERPLLVAPEPVVVTLWVQADAPVASVMAFDWAVWFGSSRGMHLSAISTDGAPVLPGAPVRIELRLAFDELLPLAVPAGEALQLFALSGKVHEQTGILKILYGGTTASKVGFTGANLTDDPLRYADRGDETTLRGSIPHPGWPLGALGAPVDSIRQHAVTLGDNATFLEVRLRQTGGPINPGDIDMDLFDRATRLAGSHTPYAEESMLVAGPAVEALRGKPLHIRVSVFLAGPDTPYELLVRHD